MHYASRRVSAVTNDISNPPKEFTGAWNAYSENEVSEYYASIAFVARVRTKAGRVFEANLTPVLEEARKLSKKFSPENLEPKPQKQ
jgi:hypothetical protein